MLRYHERAAPPPQDEATEFILSDGSVDRMGDVIEPAGWDLGNFRNHPIALFNHDRDQVVGRWADVRVKGDQLLGKLDLADGGTSPLVDTVRSLVRQKILRAVSVGFRAIKKEKLTEQSDDYFGPFRFTKTELMECSLVSVPANPNALALAKDFPRELIAEIFRKPAPEDEARSSRLTGKSAQSSAKPKGTRMTLSQKIQSAQKRIVDLRDKLTALAGNDQLGDDERDQADELPGMIEAEEKELQRLERMEKALAPKAGTGPTAQVAGGIVGEVLPPAEVRSFVMPKKKIEPADYVFRSIATGVRAFGQQLPLDQALREMYGNDEATQTVLRAAVNPGMTTVAGWAAELVLTANAAFLDRLIAESIYGPLAAMGARYDLGRNGQMKIPTRASSPKAAGAWVGEGAPKPVKRIGLSSITLTPHKLAVISTFTEEMALYSTPAIEGLLRQAMSDDTSEALDGFLIDNVAASASRPAGLLNGVTPITASAATPPAVAMIADLKALVGAIVANGGGRTVAILVNPAQALSIGFAQTTTGDFVFTSTDQAGQKFNARIITSRTIPAGTVIAVDAADFATVTGDMPRFAVSNEATLHEEDTTPLALSATGTPNVVAAPMRSLFQTDSIAIRLSLYVTWAMRRTGMVQTIAAVIW